MMNGDYLGATDAELRQYGPGRRLKAMITQRALFRHRGTIALEGGQVILGDWSGGRDLVLDPADVSSIDHVFTALYGRFIGGLANAGAPLVLHTTEHGDLYLLIDRREFSEYTENPQWMRYLTAWLGTRA